MYIGCSYRCKIVTLSLSNVPISINYILLCSMQSTRGDNYLPNTPPMS